MEIGALYYADWRCDVVVQIAEDTEVPGLGILKAGMLGKGWGIADYGADHVEFTLPNATSLFLNLSQEHYDKAESLKGDLKSNDDTIIFAYFESLMASMVFAYTALESFANDEIPDGYVFSLNKSKCKEAYNKEQIERNLSLELKLGEILPTIHHVPSPKGTKCWQDYTSLEKIRHSIIHMKKGDREHIGCSSDSIWRKLIQSQISNPAMVAKNIVNFFYKELEHKPYWYLNMPF